MKEKEYKFRVTITCKPNGFNHRVVRWFNLITFRPMVYMDSYPILENYPDWKITSFCEYKKQPKIKIRKLKTLCSSDCIPF